MIATDLQPISIVEDKGFKNLISTPDSRYESPSRRALMTTHFHENIRKELQAKLNNNSYVSLTTDLWTSLQTKSYCGVTVHYITNSWELRSAVLETFEFSTSHTADHIAAQLKRVSVAWNIEQKVVCVVNDNASNMVAAISKTSWRHLPCFAHSLNLVVQDSIKCTTEISDLQRRCKLIVNHFHRSVKSTTKLHEIQRSLSLPEHKLKQDVTTRWNSTLEMFQRIHEQFEAVTTTQCLVGESLTQEDKSILSMSLTVLQPFLEATENISGDTYVSSPMIIPLIRLLQQSMQRHLQFPLAAKLAAELSCRFYSIESAFTTGVTTLLDPRFKKMPFSTSSASDHAVTRIKNELIALTELNDETQHITSSSIIASSSSATTSTAASSSTSTPLPSLWNTFDQRVLDATAHRKVQTDTIIEVRRFLEEPCIDRHQDPLIWWQYNAIRFAKLQRVAWKYLCIPGSSVPSEHLFSKAGQVISERRNRLKPKNVDMLLFLSHNMN